MQAALQQVCANQGRPGLDGMRVDELPDFLKAHWPAITDQLLHGTDQPMVSRGVEIPKPGSQENRKRGLPGGRDRVMQQAILPVLQGRWDPTVAEFRDGVRPGRSAHQAVAQAHVSSEPGDDVVVEVDLETFCEHVGPDPRRSRLAERIADKRLLTLIRASLPAGILADGGVTVPKAGTPPGSPLAPFLSQGVLDEVDKELEARGHRVCRYADASKSYGRSISAGEGGMASRKRFITGRLTWKGHESKSAVEYPQNRSCRGVSFTGGRSAKRRKIAPKALARVKARVTTLTRRNQGRSLGHGIATLNPYLRGWGGDCGFCQTSKVLRDVDSGMCHRRRCLQWKQGKGERRRQAELLTRGLQPEVAHTPAFSAQGPWRISHTPGVRMALNNQCFDRMGLSRLSAHHRI